MKTYLVLKKLNKAIDFNLRNKDCHALKSKYTFRFFERECWEGKYILQIKIFISLNKLFSN